MSEFTNGFGKPIETKKRILIPEQEYEELKSQVVELKLEVDAKQARIDELMLEFCPNEMSQEQLDNWGKHQVPADPQSILDLCSSLG